MRQPWEDDPIIAPASAPWDRDPVVAPSTQPSQWELAKRGLQRIWEDPKQALNVGPLKAIPEAIDAAKLPGDVAAGRVDPMSEEGIARAGSFAATFSPMSAAAGTGRAIAMARAKPAVPTSEELLAAGGQGFKDMRNMGVDYRPEAVSNLAQGVRSGLEADALIPEIAPKTNALLGKLEAPPEAVAAPLGQLYAARKGFSRIANNPLAAEDRAAATAALKRVDEFIERADPETVLAGPAADAARVLQDAKGNYAAGKRAETLGNIEDRAELRAAGANSGRNLGNTLRQKTTDQLVKRGGTEGFNDAEIAALEQVVRGTPTQNAIRTISNMLGGGGGLGSSWMALLGGLGGGAAGGVTGAALGAAGASGAGAVTRSIANRMTERAFNRADESVRMRSPLYGKREAEMPPVFADPATEDITRTLMMMQQSPSPDDAEPLRLRVRPRR